MRQDISKVICERPRLQPSDEATRVSRRNWRQNPNDDMTFIGMKRIHKLRHGHGGAKELNENLRPLYRFLGSRCGKKWNDVYSEICSNLNKNSAVQLHVFQHLDHMVEKDTQIINGVVCDSKGKELYRFRNTFYVDDDGILCSLSKHPKSKYSYNRNAKNGTYRGTNVNYIRSDNPLMDYCLIDGIWYEVEFKEVNLNNYFDSFYDHILRKKIYTDSIWRYTRKIHQYRNGDEWCNYAYRFGENVSRYDRNVNGKTITRIPIKKRQLNSKEIRQKVA